MLIDGATVDLERENQRLRAELRAQTRELRGSRARLVDVGDAERRRLERDLHDGAQSRFAGVALQLRLAQRKAPPDSELARMLETRSASSTPASRSCASWPAASIPRS